MFICRKLNSYSMSLDNLFERFTSLNEQKTILNALKVIYLTADKVDIKIAELVKENLKVILYYTMNKRTGIYLIFLSMEQEFSLVVDKFNGLKVQNKFKGLKVQNKYK